MSFSCVARFRFWGICSASAVALLLGMADLAVAAPMIYVANAGNNTITIFSDTGTTSTLNITGVALNQPWGLAYRNGDLYVANGATNSVLRINAATGVSTTFNTTTNGLSTPRGLAFDSSGNLYVASTGTAAMSKFDSSGNAATFNVTGTTNNIDQMMFDSSGNLIAAAQGSGLYIKITISGTSGTVSTLVNDPAKNAVGLALDGTGNLYTGRFGTNPGVFEYTSAGSPATFTMSANITGASDVAFSPDFNTLYVVDFSNTSVKQVAISGTNGTVTNFGPASGVLSQPRGIVVLVPEPASLGLLGIGALGLLARRRRAADRD